jgi:hypothetical protein
MNVSRYGTVGIEPCNRQRIMLHGSWSIGSTINVDKRVKIRYQKIKTGVHLRV